MRYGSSTQRPIRRSCTRTFYRTGDFWIATAQRISLATIQIGNNNCRWRHFRACGLHASKNVAGDITIGDISSTWVWWWCVCSGGPCLLRKCRRRHLKTAATFGDNLNYGSVGGKRGPNKCRRTCIFNDPLSNVHLDTKLTLPQAKHPPPRSRQPVREAVFVFWFPSTDGCQNERAGGLQIQKWKSKKRVFQVVLQWSIVLFAKSPVQKKKNREFRGSQNVRAGWREPKYKMLP